MLLVSLCSSPPAGNMSTESKPEAMTQGACPSENDILALTQGRQTAERRTEVIAHLGSCDGCRLIVGEASRALAPAPRVRSEMSTFSAGALLGGRYQINRRIGSGGMGEVYETTDLLLKERVACKTLICSALDDDRAARRLRAEVQLARRVSHRNVCRILEFGVCQTRGDDATDDIPFFTMELLAGQTLSARLAARQRFDVEEAGPLVQQMLDGLSAIHAEGIVHRDFKADNIFLVDEERGARVVITDFGLACAVDLSRSLAGSGGKIIGTLDYMAPEQLVGSQPTAAFDIYALGVVLFESLTGRRPFARENPIAGAVQRFTREAPLLSSVIPGANRAWERVIARCLARAPSERYATVDAVRADLFPSAAPRRGWPRARLAHWGLSAAGLGLLGSLLLRGISTTAAPKPMASPASLAARERPLPTRAPAISVVPPASTDAKPGNTSLPSLPRSAPNRRFGTRARTIVRPATQMASTDGPRTAAPANQRRDSIYSPRFDVKPISPSLGSDGLPTPYMSSH
jgi:serine/threonine protein kinase